MNSAVTYRLCHVGGEDVDARIPLLKTLEPAFKPFAIGSGSSSKFDSGNIPFFSYDLRRGISPLADIHATRQLTQHFKFIRPHIVHAFDTKPAIYAMSAGKRAEVPVLLRTITGLGYLFSEENLRTKTLKIAWMRLQKKAGRHASWTVFQNEADREVFLEGQLVDPDRTSVISGSGVDVDGTLARRESDARLIALKDSLGLHNGPVIMMAARLVRQKGVREYIAAAASLHSAYPNAQFLLVGPSDTDGRDAISTEELSRLPKNVIWTGYRNDIPALLQLSDIMVLPSYYREGIPRILMEAALLGVPIVTTDMPGCRDAVDQGRLGILVPPKSVEGLSAGIKTLLNMRDEERKSLGAKCGSFVSQHLSLSRISDQYRDLYIELGELSAAVKIKE